jgi:hypothetical protein
LTIDFASGADKLVLGDPIQEKLERKALMRLDEKTGD